VVIEWEGHDIPSRGGPTTLSGLTVSNTSGQGLTNVVVEIVVETGWGERVAHYAYFRTMAPGAGYRVSAHPWFDLEGATVSSARVSGSLWSDQLNGALAGSRGANPHPDPRPAEAHARFLEEETRESRAVYLWGALTLSNAHILVSE
jgi:hypothetical protein